MGRKSRNIIAILLCFIMPVAFTGCANNNSNNSTDKSAVPASTGISSGSGDTSSEDEVSGEPGYNTENNNNNIQNTEPVEAGINVTRINGLCEDFICGADISSIKSEYESGVQYYDFEGNSLAYSPGDGEKGFFTFLKEWAGMDIR